MGLMEAEFCHHLSRYTRFAINISYFRRDIILKIIITHVSLEGSVCPHCKKGIMRMRSAVFDINIPDTGDTKELLCDMCRHRVVTVAIIYIPKH